MARRLLTEQKQKFPTPWAGLVPWLWMRLHICNISTNQSVKVIYFSVASYHILESLDSVSPTRARVWYQDRRNFLHSWALEPSSSLEVHGGLGTASRRSPSMTYRHPRKDPLHLNYSTEVGTSTSPFHRHCAMLLHRDPIVSFTSLSLRSIEALITDTSRTAVFSLFSELSQITRA